MTCTKCHNEIPKGDKIYTIIESIIATNGKKKHETVLEVLCLTCWAKAPLFYILSRGENLL